MLLRTALVALSLVASSVSLRAESVPVSQNGEPLPQVEGLTAKEVATIASLIVIASIAAYRKGAKGPCACPTDRDRKGNLCGGRSARDRAGGWVVYCYLADVPAPLIHAKARERAGTGGIK